MAKSEKPKTVQQSSGMSIAGFVLGISSLATSALGIGGIVGVVGIVLSAIGLKKGARRGLAITGLITSIVGVVLGFVLLIAITIVAYAGIQLRADDSMVAANASTFQKTAEVYNAENGTYPTYDQLVEAASKYELDSTDITAIEVDNEATITYEYCNGIGAQIWYYSAVGKNYTNLVLGDTSACVYE